MSEKMTPKTLRKPPFLFGSVQVEAWLQAHADAWDEQVRLPTEENKQLRTAIDAMMRECGSEPDSRYARNACIIGSAALAAGEET